VDIVFAPDRGLDIVGAMTHARNFEIAANAPQVGVRFRPGMAPGFVRAPGSQTTDRLVPLAETWGAKGRELQAKMNDTDPGERRIALLEAQLLDASSPGVVQRVAAHIVVNHGQLRVDDLAFDAGMSARQLRRVFIEQLGLSPKHFCRVVRFRHSLVRMRGAERGDFTQVALDSGYYDQAHFINEFREFSGYSPGEFAALPR